MVINMNIGGTEKALLNMISEMPKENYDITILMLEKFGGFLDSVPKEVHVEYLDDYEHFKNILNNPPKSVIFELLKQMKIAQAFIYLLLYLISSVFGERSILFKYLLRNYQFNNSFYDVAVAYAGPMDFISYFVINKIKAKVKIQWIHFDITKIGFNKIFAGKNYKKLDKVFVVSNEAKIKLIETLPFLKEKTEEFHNVVSPEVILSQSKVDCGFDDNFTGIRILTVGRLANEKGQDMAIRVLAKLLEYGHNIKWYCIGEGNCRKEYEQLIEQYSVKDNFVLLGAKMNPYPYIEQCDIYVQPSRYEGYCITLIEARCLNKPIVTTRVNGANEQIKHGKTGLVVGIDENELFVSVKELIDNPSLCGEFSRNLNNEKIESAKQMEKIYKLIG